MDADNVVKVVKFVMREIKILILLILFSLLENLNQILKVGYSIKKNFQYKLKFNVINVSMVIN
jgi:hypothetical protein